MTITWVLCTDRMPPDDSKKIIVKSESFNTGVVTGRWAHSNKNITDISWIPYSEQTWKEVSNGRN